MHRLLVTALLYAFAGCVSAQGQEEVEVLLQTTTSWDGEELVSYGDGAPEITILRVTIPPDYEVDMHRHPTINAAILLSGQLTLYTEDGAEKVVDAGDAVVEVINKWHNGRTTSDEPAVLLVVYAGVVGQPLTIWQE